MVENKGHEGEKESQEAARGCNSMKEMDLRERAERTRAMLSNSLGDTPGVLHRCENKGFAH